MRALSAQANRYRRTVDLVSMLVPSHTLPGWPPAPQPSLLAVLGLLVGLPAAVFVIVYVLGKAGSLISAAKPQSGAQGEPLWLNAGRAGNTKAISARAALPELEPAMGAVDEDAVGGASVRW